MIHWLNVPDWSVETVNGWELAPAQAPPQTEKPAQPTVIAPAKKSEEPQVEPVVRRHQITP
jgi:hypothetical protein